ncbi:hypothetical protein ACHAXS_004132 [Conticribra weissflogii]
MSFHKHKHPHERLEFLSPRRRIILVLVLTALSSIITTKSRSWLLTIDDSIRSDEVVTNAMALEYYEREFYYANKPQMTTANQNKKYQLSRNKTTKRIPKFITQFPIYLSDPKSNRFSRLDFMTLLSHWGRKTEYPDIWNYAINRDGITTGRRSVRFMTNSSFPSIPNDKRVVMIFHTSPKTGSSALRKACMETFESICGKAPHRGDKNKQPPGYQSPLVLSKLIRNCTNTHYYCVKQHSVEMLHNFGKDIEFFHMFPFRNYDEWVFSALEQIRFRDGEEGCQDLKRLLKKCKPHKYEVDFMKYGKTRLFAFIQVVKDIRWSFKVEYSNHHIFLYDYERTDETVKQLSEKLGIPHLKGLDKKVNSHGVEKEVCEKEHMLSEMFHGCFSSMLTKLGRS